MSTPDRRLAVVVGTRAGDVGRILAACGYFDVTIARSEPADEIVRGSMTDGAALDDRSFYGIDLASTPDKTAVVTMKDGWIIDSLTLDAIELRHEKHEVPDERAYLPPPPTAPRSIRETMRAQRGKRQHKKARRR